MRKIFFRGDFFSANSFFASKVGRIKGIHRTNNAAEGWNRRWNVLIGKKHPNICSFMESLAIEERYSEGQRRIADLGNPPPKKKKCYAQNDARLEQLVRRLQDITETEAEDDPWSGGYLKYLRTVGHSARGLFDEN